MLQHFIDVLLHSCDLAAVAFHVLMNYPKCLFQIVFFRLPGCSRNLFLFVYYFTIAISLIFSPG